MAQSLRIGTLDLYRGGFGSLLSGDHNVIRSAIQGNFSCVTISGTSSLTADFLQTVDLVWLSVVRQANNVTITPLSSAEQSALLDFVMSGGRALIFVDNVGFNNANQNLLAPFGLTIGSTHFIQGEQTVTVQLPHTPVTEGTFGTLTTFRYFWPGWFAQMGPNADCLATVNANGQCALAFIPPQRLSSASGGVVLFSDDFPFDDAINGTDPEVALVLNAIEATGMVEPGDVNRDGCVDDADLAGVIFAFGQTGSLPEDLNCDGIVDDADLALVIFDFGNGC